MALYSRENLLENLKDKRFRDSFVSARVDGGTAFQIRHMREMKGWTQADLAKLLGTSQNAVWRLESRNYGKASTSTFKKIASVFDVALVIRFIRFSELTDQVLNQDTEYVTVDSFDEDTKLWKPKVPAKEREGKLPKSKSLSQMESGDSQDAFNIQQKMSPIFGAIVPERRESGGALAP